MASVFSGRAGRQAAMWTAGQAQEQYEALRQLYGAGWDRARGALTEGYDQARPLMRAGYEGARDQTRQGYLNARGDMRFALRDLSKAYGKGIATQRGAASSWAPLRDEDMRGYNMFGDAMGTHGAEGQARARASFQAGPGYQWQVEQASDAAAREANRRGQTYGGNTVDAIARLGSNLANQEWGSHLDRLQSYQGAAHQSQAGYAGALENLAQMYGQMGQGQANIRQNMGGQAMQYGQAQAGNVGNYFGNMANLELNQGQTMANAATGQMNDQVGALNQYYGTVLPAGQQGMMAGQQAAANRFGAIMGGLQLGGQMLGMGMPTSAPGVGGGSVGGSMAGGFGTFLKGLFG